MTLVSILQNEEGGPDRTVVALKQNAERFSDQPWITMMLNEDLSNHISNLEIETGVVCTGGPSVSLTLWFDDE